MKLPGFLMRHSVSVEPYKGSGAYGPQYGPAVNVKCFRDDRRQLVRAPNGDEVVSETTIYCRLTENIPAESRVTLSGRTTTVITVKERSGGGLATPDHLEVVLK